MSFLPVRGASRAQPRVGTPRINWAHPLARSLRAAFVGGIPVEVASGAALTTNAITRAVSNGLASTQAPSTSTGAYTNVSGLSQPSALTAFAIIAPEVGEQWYGVDNDRYLLSTRTAGNAGWAWGRFGAVGGGALGNLTHQAFVVQGVALYQQSTDTIPSLSNTKVAITIDGSTLSYYDDAGLGGPLKSNGTSTIGSISAGENLWFLAQGNTSTGWKGNCALALVWNRALTPAELQALSLDPWGLFEDSQAAWLISSSAPTGNVGLSSETDSAYALASSAAKQAGLSTEASSALSLEGVSKRAAGLASESDSAFALAALQNAQAGLASSAETAFALSAGISGAVGLAAESDTAFALSAKASKAVGLASEADAALALSAGAQGSVGTAAESDSSLALAATQKKAVGLSASAEQALALTPMSIRVVGAATSTETAQQLSARLSKQVGVAVESNAALNLTTDGSQSAPVGLAVESDAALSLGAVSATDMLYVVPGAGMLFSVSGDGMGYLVQHEGLTYSAPGAGMSLQVGH